MEENRLRRCRNTFLVADDVQFQPVVPLASGVVAPSVRFVEAAGWPSLRSPETSEVIVAFAHRLLRFAQQGGGDALTPARGMDKDRADMRDTRHGGLIWATKLVPGYGCDQAILPIECSARPQLRVQARVVALRGLPTGRSKASIGSLAARDQLSHGTPVASGQVTDHEICW